LLNLIGKNPGVIFYPRNDYEEVAPEGANELVNHVNSQFETLKGKQFGNYTVAYIDNFSYTDPVDGSITTNQGIRIVFTDNSRIIIRLSGTGTKGATLRVYLESYEPDVSKQNLDTQEALGELITIAEEIAHIKKFTRRDVPTVIT